jgi:hypothetical protein
MTRRRARVATSAVEALLSLLGDGIAFAQPLDGAALAMPS